MWVPKEIRVGNIAPLSLSQIPFMVYHQSCASKDPYLLPKNKSWMTFCYLQHRRPAHQQDLCCHFSVSKNAHRLMRTAKICKKKDPPPPPPPRPHSLGHLRCSDISSPIISCYAPVISSLEHCIVISYLPGIVRVASLSTCSRVVRETDAPNMIPSAVSSTAFNSGMWVGAIRIG